MRVLVIATMAGLLTACPKASPPDADAGQSAESKATDSKADDSKPKPPPLSEEDKRLIALDPAELTPELRRKRAYALRRKAMQNPDSPLARTLDDLQKASLNGEIDPNGSAMPTFTVDGKPPTGGKGPAGTRKGPAGVRADPQ
ncbi:MAG: hypothetical protein ACRBN8_00115 [Nannocystales bacterium]